MFCFHFPVVLVLKPFKDVLVEIYSHRRKAFHINLKAGLAPCEEPFLKYLMMAKIQYFSHFLKINVKHNDVSLPTLCQMSIAVVKSRRSHTKPVLALFIFRGFGGRCAVGVS